MAIVETAMTETKVEPKVRRPKVQDEVLRMAELRTFGVEIECDSEYLKFYYQDSDDDDDCSGDDDATPRVFNKLLALRDGWDHHSEHCGWEFKSPVLRGDSDIQMIRDAIRTIYGEGGQSGDYVGMHVHIGAHGFGAYHYVKVVSLWLEFEDRIYNTFDVWPGREHSYCAKLSDVLSHINLNDGYVYYKDWRSYYKIRGGWYDNRYVGLNFTSIPYHNTIEFRLFNGCLNADYAERAIRFARVFVEAAIQYAQGQITKAQARSIIDRHI